MTVSTEDQRPPVGSLPTAISAAIVKLMAEYTGRGPTKARTTIRDNVVVVMLEQTLTKGEAVVGPKGSRGEGAGDPPRVSGVDARGELCEGRRADWVSGHGDVEREPLGP